MPLRIRGQWPATYAQTYFSITVYFQSRDQSWVMRRVSYPERRQTRTSCRSASRRASFQKAHLQESSTTALYHSPEQCRVKGHVVYEGRHKMTTTGNVRFMGPLQFRLLRAQVKSSVRFQYHNNVQPFRLVRAIGRGRELDTHRVHFTELFFHAGMTVSGRYPDLVTNIAQSCRAGRHVSRQSGFLQFHGCTTKLRDPRSTLQRAPLTNFQR